MLNCGKRMGHLASFAFRELASNKLSRDLSRIQKCHKFCTMLYKFQDKLYSIKGLHILYKICDKFIPRYAIQILSQIYTNAQNYLNFDVKGLHLELTIWIIYPNQFLVD